jgi:hypothetical protein
MNVALMSIIVASQLGNAPFVAVADVVPVINIEQNCRATAATDKSEGLDLPQSVQDCVSDENAARQQLAMVWMNYSASVRDRCAEEATLDGIGSYVDLLTCMQMSDPATMQPRPDWRGASRNRHRD